MKKLSQFLVLVFTFLFVFSGVALASHKPDHDLPVIPERDGDYADPEHPGVRVRVFVHKTKLETATASSCVDPDSTSVVSWAGWKLPNGNWTYNLNPSSVPSTVGSANLPTIAANGFNVWQNAAQNKINFVKGANTTKTRNAYDGVNIIAWGRTSGSALGVTYVRYFTVSRLVVDVDTIMNKKFAWSWSGNIPGSCGDPNSYDAQNILVHEQGHWLGLDDEYDAAFVDNSMFGFGSKGEIKKDTPTTGDVAGVAAIYP